MDQAAMAHGTASLSASSLLAERLAAGLEARRLQGLQRELRVRQPGSHVLDLSNNDYLRLSQHPEVKAAAIAATEQWGCSSSASPLISGYTAAHESLLETLKAWYGFSSGMLWNTGYAANQAVLSQLPQRGDLVLADRLIHNSMINGLLASGARLQRYRHLDMAHLEELLSNAGEGERAVFVVTESVFSMDGDYPDLRVMAELKARHGFVWIVDEAHAIGWYGKSGSGLAEAIGVTGHIDVLVGTLGKGLGSMGAFTLFHDDALRRHLLNHAGEFIYSTYLPPACAVAAEAAIGLVRAEPGRCGRLCALSRRFRGMLPAAPAGDSPIVPVPVDDPVEAADSLRERGILAGAVRPPTVPEDEGRLRVSLHADLTESELQPIAAAIKEVLA